MKKRAIIRVISYSLSAFALICGLAVYQYREANLYKMQLGETYQRAFYDLIDYVKTIDASLEKGVHASSPSQLIILSGEIWREAGGAKAALSQLPLNDVQIEQLAKYLSQVGDYTYSLSKKVINQESVTQEEQQRLQELSTYSRQLTQDLMNMERQLISGDLTLARMKNLPFFSQSTTHFLGDQLEEVEKKFNEYPSLIYDGPFSDHIEQQAPRFLEDKGWISADEAKEKAAQLLGVDVGQLDDCVEGNGKIATYTFSTKGDDLRTVSFSQQGGYPLYLLDARAVSAPVLQADEAIEKAKEYLDLLGFADMKESYFLQADGVLTINFAFVQGEYTCYSDLIKVSIALDDGGVVAFESHGYLNNHLDNRDLATPAMSPEQAVEHLNPRLAPQETSLAVIPTAHGTEIPVYAILCTNAEDRSYIVFINTQNGREEKLLMLITTDAGTLTM